MMVSTPMQCSLSQARSGFTLVELSIVLVILGLLIGGVLTGQSLIRAAELRSVTTQHARFVTATQTFRDKYMALPGDMTNASRYWGAADGSNGNTAACLSTASTTTATCNGNGDGVLYTSTASRESYRFWQHLANAGLIEGSYNGIQGGTYDYSSTTSNSPSGRISGTLWFAFTWGNYVNDPDLFDGVYDNFFEIGGFNPNNEPAVSKFKPEEMYNIDMKIDDGKPGTGFVIPRNRGAACTNATSSTDFNAAYALNSSALGCTIIFRKQF